jgi:hypothetical protein
VQTGRNGVGEQGAQGHRATGTRIEGDDLAVVAEPAVRPIDLVEDGLDGDPGGVEIAVVDDESDAGAQGAPVRDPRLGHDDPVAACAVPVVVVGAAVAWVVVVEPDVDVEPVVVFEVPPVADDVSVETMAAVVTSFDVPS